MKGGCGVTVEEGEGGVTGWMVVARPSPTELWPRVRVMCVYELWPSPTNSLWSRLLNSCFDVLRVSVQHLETVTFAGGKRWDEWRERLIDSL